MGLYVGGKQVKLNLNNALYHFNLFSSSPIVNNILLWSSDDFILKDSNGIYLTAMDAAALTVKEDE